MKPLLFVLIVVLVCVSSSAFSSGPPATAKPVELEEQVKTLSAKLEILEKRLAELEKTNRERIEALRSKELPAASEPASDPTDNLKRLLLQNALQGQLHPKEANQRPKFQLLNHTELGVPFSVEWAMMGDAYRYQQVVPRESYEYKIEPQVTPNPEFRLNPEP